MIDCVVVPFFFVPVDDCVDEPPVVFASVADSVV